MTALAKLLLLAYFLFIYCILDPQNSAEENAVGGRFMRHGKIFGPEEPERELPRAKFPFLVMVQIVLGQRRERICTGTIVSASTVITSSVCLLEEVSTAFWAGNVRYLYKEDFDPPTQGREMLRRIVNPDYFGNATVAIGTTDKNWIWSNVVAPVGLYFKQHILTDSWHDNCIVSGFGPASPVTDDSRVGRFIVQKVVSRVGCLEKIPSEAHICSRETVDRTFCAGDTGGPIMCHTDNPGWLLMFGVIDARTGPRNTKRMMDLDCLLPQAENRYLFVGFFRPWLKQNIPDLPSELTFYNDSGLIKHDKLTRVMQQEPPQEQVDTSSARMLTVCVQLASIIATTSVLAPLMIT